MPASNEIYNAPADIWWADDQPLSMIRTALNPVRLRYLTDVLARSGADPARMTVADIGCGGRSASARTEPECGDRCDQRHA